MKPWKGDVPLTTPPSTDHRFTASLHRKTLLYVAAKAGTFFTQMNITATVENNIIKLPAGVHLPDGTPVRVEPLSAPHRKSFGQRYAKFIGAVKDAPTDLAENHDHYLYGTPKRTP